MKRLQTKLALVAGALTIGGIALAAGGEVDPLDAMLEGITLTDQQQALADRLRADAQEGREALEAAHEEMVDVFLSELERGDPDRGRLYGQADAFVDLIGDVSRDKLDGVLDLYEALEPDQQETFRQNIEDLRGQADMF